MNKENKMENIIIDVREKDEFQNEQVLGSINLPLSCFSQEAPVLLGKFDHQRVSLMCLSGKRSGMAFDLIKKMPNLNLSNYEVYPKGIKGWKENGKEIVNSKKGPLPLMRQVQIAAGIFIILGAILGTAVHPYFWFLSAFVGAGLTFSGVTGSCALAGFLKKMPWNK
jgi:rhodanese-related sulfurtransferase